MNNWHAVVVFIASVGVTLLFYISRKVEGLVNEERRIRLALEKLVEAKG